MDILVTKLPAQKIKLKIHTFLLKQDKILTFSYFMKFILKLDNENVMPSHLQWNDIKAWGYKEILKYSKYSNKRVNISLIFTPISLT